MHLPCPKLLITSSSSLRQTFGSLGTNDGSIESGRHRAESRNTVGVGGDRFERDLGTGGGEEAGGGQADFSVGVAGGRGVERGYQQSGARNEKYRDSLPMVGQRRVHPVYYPLRYGERHVEELRRQFLLGCTDVGAGFLVHERAGRNL